MDTILLAQLEDNTWQRIDVFEDIPITLTIQQNDISNLTNRRVPYSKTIQIPDTTNNAQIFEHYYEVNGTLFNSLQKISCIVQYRGTDIFQGIMRLNSVTTNNDERLYEIYLMGEVTDFTAPLKNLQLQDLDYTDLLHELAYSSVTQSWECVNDGASGLFNGQIIYPLINYGLDYQGSSDSGATPTFTYDFDMPRSFDQSAFPVQPSMFKPAIQLKSVLDRMINQTDYTIVSEFFDSPYFTSIYMDTFQNGKIGNDYVSGITNQNIFRTYMNARGYAYDKDTTHNLPFSDNIGPAYNPLNNYLNGLGNPNNAEYASFQVPYAGNYGFNIRFNVLTTDLCIYGAILVPDIVIRAYRHSSQFFIVENGTMFYESAPIKLSQAYRDDFLGLGNGPLPVNLFFNDSFTAGEFIKVVIFDKTSWLSSCIGGSNGIYRIQAYNDGTLIDPLPLYELYESPVIPNELLDIRLGIPNLDCVQFLKSLITMFNLVVTQDEQAKTLRIEPYTWEYNDQDRTVRDWTKILDLNSDVKIEPLSFDLSKDQVWTYQFTDNEYLPKLWHDQYDFVFGRERFTSASNFFSGEKIYEVPFGSCPTSGVTNAPNFIIPQFYYNNNQQQAPYATKPHLFFWVGNRLAYKDALKTQQGSWYLSSGNTPIEWTTYPAVSHLSTIDSQLSAIISDLNFRSTFDFFGNSNTQIQQFTDFNIYNVFWRSFTDNLYDPTGRRLTGNFYFRPIDVYETKLNDKIWIKDSFYTIEKMFDADLVNKRLTKISLIKENIPYYKVEPPAPIYIYGPNEPYPIPENFYYDLAYISTDQASVCTNTATQYTFYSENNNFVIENDDIIYLDLLTPELLPMGTYIQQVGQTTTFVCVDTYGRVLQTTC